MNDTLRDAWVTVLDRVLTVAAQDDPFRSSLRAVAEGVIAATDNPALPGFEVAGPNPLEDDTGAGVGSRPPAAASDGGTESAGDPGIHVPRPDPVPGRRAEGRALADTDLAALAERLWLKAEAARWAGERDRLLAAGADYRLEVAPQDRELFSKGKAHGCHLWMLDPHGRRPAGPDDFGMIAACYETASEAVALTRLIGDGTGWAAGEVEPAATLLARSQSALRYAVGGCQGHVDPDQQLVYELLRDFAHERGVYIREGMTLADPVDPSEWVDIAGRIHALRVEFERRDDARRAQAKRLGRLRHKAALLAADPTGAAGEWPALVAVVEELVAGGMPPTRRELRDALSPVADRVPAGLRGAGPFGVVLRAVVRHRAADRPSGPGAAAGGPSVEVREAAALLAGKSVVLIGGDARPAAWEAIERAFGLKELVWIATTSHQSYRDFESAVARPDVAAVLLAIRWASHSFGEVKGLCDRHGKPLVRLPGGYNPNQVAAAIMGQASARLRADSAGPAS